jgi:hypothetical protein
MALKTAQLTIDRSLLPQKSDNLGIRFERHSVAKIKTASPPGDMVLIKPAGALLSAEEAVGPEPRWNYILCGMHLKAMDGTDVRGTGHLVITGQRFIGMIDSGTATGGPPLSVATSGNIFCFTCRRDDVYPPQVKKHRLTPSDFSFRSKEEQPVAFQLLVIAAMVYVANDKMGYWHDKNMLRSLSEEGRQGLLRS